MREIKFRGLSPSKKWLYGDYIKSAFLDKKTLVLHDMIHDGKEFLTVRGKTIGQFIGECDKNGKEIYEGDIVLGENDIKIHLERWGCHSQKINDMPDKSKYIIVWHEGKFHLNNPKDKIGWIINWHISSKVKDLIVIGNIHENPELLEENNDKKTG